jgi:hypothetical protein
MKIKNEEIRALVQAQTALPDYSADPFVQRRVGLALAKSRGACTDEKNGLDWPIAYRLHPHTSNKSRRKVRG